MVPIITFYSFITAVRKRRICQFTYMHQDTKQQATPLVICQTILYQIFMIQNQDTVTKALSANGNF